MIFVLRDRGLFFLLLHMHFYCHTESVFILKTYQYMISLQLAFALVRLKTLCIAVVIHIDSYRLSSLCGFTIHSLSVDRIVGSHPFSFRTSLQ